MTEETEQKAPFVQTHIYPATKDDLPEIEKILRDTIQTPYGSGTNSLEDEVEIQMELKRINRIYDSPEEGSLLIAKDASGKSLGFAFFGQEDPVVLNFTRSDPKVTLELRLLYLFRLQRNQGIGSQLLTEVEKNARNLGKNRIELTSGPRYFFIGTRQFYLKRGFHQAGVIMNYFDGKYPARVFQKNLE